LLLDWTETDPGVDHHAVEVAVNFRHTLHGAGTSHEGLSGGRPLVADWLASCWRLGGHLGAGDHCVGGQVGRKILRKVLLVVDWSRCGLTGVGLWSGITSDRTSAKADVGAAVKAAESVVKTINIREAGTPAGGLSVGAELDGRQDRDDGAGTLTGTGPGSDLILELNPLGVGRRQSRDGRDGWTERDLRTELRLPAADIELSSGRVHTLDEISSDGNLSFAELNSLRDHGGCGVTEQLGDTFPAYWTLRHWQIIPGLLRHHWHWQAGTRSQIFYIIHRAGGG